MSGISLAVIRLVALLKLVKSHYRPSMVIKMITFLILIIPFWGVACKDDGQGKNQPDLSVSSEQEDQDEILRRAQETQPHEGTVAPPLSDPTVLKGSGPEVLSNWPADLDGDGDQVIDRPLANRPDLPVDNCPDFFNPEQEDENHNGIGDSCE